MSFTYFKFLFVTTAKKKSVWITWLLFAFTCISFIILLPLLATMNTLQVWANTTMSICQTFMGMVAGLYTAVLSINIFKETNEEGTELIVISKPISRFKIVMSKFVVFGVYCLLVNISTVLITMFTAFLPRTEPQFYVGLLISMFIGNAVTFAIFGSISILLTINFAKVGIIITNVIISLAFLIYQSLTLFVFSTPLTELNNQNMTAGSYIVHERDTQTGEYIENEVVCFEGTPLESGEDHPCQAKNWREMKAYWEQEILPKDPSPVLNATDWASQLALTYLSYDTNRYADRQANRMFAFTRYYDYNLTSPASPEITEDIPNKQNLKWLYVGYNLTELLPGVQIILPSGMAFDAIEPVTGTRLRGYADEIPVGYVKSKELLSTREIYLEKDQWKKYGPMFDIMYEDVFDYRNYVDDLSVIGDNPDAYSNLGWVYVWNQENLSKYYKIIWACFTGNADKYMNPNIHTRMVDYDKSSFDIQNIDDLNDRFIQFKNYAFWKAYEEQNKYLTGNYEPDDNEITAKDQIKANMELLFTALGMYMPEGNSWISKSIPEAPFNFIDENSQTPNLTYMWQTWQNEYYNIPATSTLEQKAAIALNSPWTIYKKTESIYYNVANMHENYLYSSLDEPTRSWSYSGEATFSRTNWYPNIDAIAQILGQDIKVPVGQNMQWFFYETNPKMKYWIFAIIWGAVSLGLFATGIVLYNKYDVK